MEVCGFVTINHLAKRITEIAKNVGLTGEEPIVNIGIMLKENDEYPKGTLMIGVMHDKDKTGTMYITPERLSLMIN